MVPTPVEGLTQRTRRRGDPPLGSRTGPGTGARAQLDDGAAVACRAAMAGQSARGLAACQRRARRWTPSCPRRARLDVGVALRHARCPTRSGRGGGQHVQVVVYSDDVAGAGDLTPSDQPGEATV